MRWIALLVAMAAVLTVAVSRLLDLGMGMVDEANDIRDASRRRAHETEAMMGQGSDGVPADAAPRAARPGPPEPEQPNDPQLPPPPLPHPSPPSPAVRPVVATSGPPAAPREPAKPPEPYRGPTFTVGSSLAEVEAVQGRSELRSPLDARREERAWGTGRVIFRDGFVESWADPAGVLHTRTPEPKPRHVVE
jgi:hypothetical protein